ncbi:hypothetical protein BDQ12DRAFT_674035 [Crucibulum laeve]|uniref:Uncharacterized protein n=1 Tax=Crucibulum laeve TaxID=68775 RepID=A0A5C3MK43_9AGAR|nr:hypothetical protein BDQ12DRAFT_674035 [Crucibulum laeve]
MLVSSTEPAIVRASLIMSGCSLIQEPLLPGRPRSLRSRYTRRYRKSLLQKSSDSRAADFDALAIIWLAFSFVVGLPIAFADSRGRGFLRAWVLD